MEEEWEYFVSSRNFFILPELQNMLPVLQLRWIWEWLFWKNMPNDIVVSKGLIKFIQFSVSIYLGFPVGINMPCDDLCYDRSQQFVLRL